MSPSMQKTLAWSGALFVALFFPALIITGLLPPFAASKTAAEAAEFWSTNTGLKRCGVIMMLAACGLQVPFGVLIAVRIRQMEGRYTPLAYAELVGCGLAVCAFIFPILIFGAASFRPERNPEITQALNDLAWLGFIMNWPPAVIQALALGFAILCYGAKQVLPRWVGYYNLWSAFIFSAGGLAVLFKDGVFAWSGLLAFWVAATFFGVWYLVMTWQLLATIHTTENGGQAESVAMIPPGS